MAYEYFESLFKDGDNDKQLTFAEFQKALESNKELKIANLADGGYVSADKFKAKETELAGVQQQLTDANTTIQGMKEKGADVDGKIKEWEEKYAADTKALQDQMQKQRREYAENLFLSGYKFSSKAAKAGVLAELRAQEFKLSDKGELTGAADWIKSLSENEDYKAAFVTEKPEDQQTETPPRFSAGSNGGRAGGENKDLFSFGFQHLREKQ